MANQMPSMKARDLLAMLQRKPLSYVVVRQTGSHRRMESPYYPPLTFAFHDGDTIGAGMVRKILVNSVGLTTDEIAGIL